MGALFISLEHELTEIDLSPQAPALAEHEELLADVADELHVPHLMHFFHTPVDDDNPARPSDEGNHESETDEEEEDDFDSEEEQWFDAAEGRNTIESLIHHFDDHPEETPDGVVEELQAFDEILAQAEEHDVRWHFDMDI